MGIFNDLDWAQNPFPQDSVLKGKISMQLCCAINIVAKDPISVFVVTKVERAGTCNSEFALRIKGTEDKTLCHFQCLATQR